MFPLEPPPDITLRVAQELCNCIDLKSKRIMGAWTWVSLSNLRIYYDSLVATSKVLPPDVDLVKVLNKLSHTGIIEVNPDLFLKDRFYRLTRTGRNILHSNNMESIWVFDAF